MEKGDPRQSAFSRVDLSQSSVVRAKPIVFLFGGKVGDLTSSNTETSVRAELLKFISIHRSSLLDSVILVTPEEFKDWLNDATYPDLLTFEKDLASTACLVVIALESPGAIAELGAFSVETNLKSKLLILLTQQHYEEESFICLGPLRQLDSNKNIIAYPFDYGARLSKTLGSHLPEIVDAIEDLISPTKQSTKFDKQNSGHIAFLIHEMIILCRALTAGEISKYLKLMQVTLEAKDVHRFLFLLQKINLIRVEKFGRPSYYTAVECERRVHLSMGNSGAKFERTEFMIEVGLYYENCTTERERKRYIRERLK